MIGALLRRAIPERFLPTPYLTRLVQKRTAGIVRQGPFATMKYVANAVGSAYMPKLLGIYERELNPCMAAICGAKPKLIADVGAAEGYYAVGLALVNPQARVIAFEMVQKGRDALNEMAKLNGVSHRLDIRGRCEPEDLRKALDGADAPVVICDVEGYEDVLLDPIAVPALRKAIILVELHDFIIPGITETLKKRFGATHRITHIWQQPRSRADFPWHTVGTMLLPGLYLDRAVSELRPVRMAWLWMEPKTN